MGFSRAAGSGATVCCSAQASQRSGFSCCGAWALGRVGFSSLGIWYLCCDMWDLPGPGIEPVSPALTGRFPTPEPPGKPHHRRFVIGKAEINFTRNLTVLASKRLYSSGVPWLHFSYSWQQWWVLHHVLGNISVSPSIIYAPYHSFHYFFFWKINIC